MRLVCRPVLLLLLCALASRSGFAQAPPTPAPYSRVGIVSIQDAILASAEGKQETEALNARFAPRQQQLKTLNATVEQLKAQVKKDTDSGQLTSAELNKEIKNLETEQKQLQAAFESAQSDYEKASQEMINRLGKKMLNVLENYAASHGYDVILDVSNPQTPVLWAGKGSNITKELVDAYDATYPVK